MIKLILYQTLICRLCNRCAFFRAPRHRVDFKYLLMVIHFCALTMSEFTTRNDPIFFSLKPNFVWIKLELRSEDLL